MLKKLVDRGRTTAVVALTSSLLWPGPDPAGAAQEHEAHEHDAHEHEAQISPNHSHGSLHFTHPLIAESVSPDTKIRFDHQLVDRSDEDALNLGVLEGEYAFLPALSIEAGIPYSYTDGAFGNLEVALKFANFALAEHGVLLGYGIEFGFPTAEEIGEPEDHHEEAASLRAGASAPSISAPSRASTFSASSLSSTGGEIGEAKWEVAPFLNFGLKRNHLEIVAWGILGVPFAQDEGEDVETEIEYNLSAMYHVSPRVQALLELDGAGGVSGHAVGEDVLNLSPGLRWQILPDQPLVIGTSVGFPLTDEETFSARWATSVFWHF